jgi:hypothetical protein
MRDCTPALRVIIIAAQLAAASNRAPNLLPTPTGPYSVGRTSLQLTDESRADDASPDGHRQLVVWLWYPAAKHQKKPAAWQPGKWAELYWTRFLRSHPDSASVGARYPIQAIQSHSYSPRSAPGSVDLEN